MKLTLRRWWIQLTADKKRFGAMCVVMLVGLLLWARVIVIARMPRQAIADDKQAAATAQSSDGVTDKRTARAVDVELDEFPERDPFTISLDHFPDTSSVPELGLEAGKSGSEPVDKNQHAGVRRLAQLEALVQRFDLEAVMTGLPMAVISGKTYRLGQYVPAIDHEQIRFELVEVRARSVILECEHDRFELVIAPPGAP